MAQSPSDRYPRVASLIHTILVLVGLGGWAFCAKILTDRLSVAANPNRVRIYLITLIVEWFFFVLVVVGVRRSGASVLVVLGDHWHSARQVLRDIGIAAGFWIVTAMLLWLLSWLLRITAPGRNLQAMLPHGGAEIALWLALSLTAGDLRGDDLSRLPATAVHGHNHERTRRHSAFCRSLRRGPRVPGLPHGDSDQPVRSNVRHSGLLAGKRSPWNDRPCMAGFIGRSGWQFNEALAPDAASVIAASP